MQSCRHGVMGEENGGDELQTVISKRMWYADEQSNGNAGCGAPSTGGRGSQGPQAKRVSQLSRSPLNVSAFFNAFAQL